MYPSFGTTSAFRIFPSFISSGKLDMGTTCTSRCGGTMVYRLSTTMVSTRAQAFTLRFGSFGSGRFGSFGGLDSWVMALLYPPLQGEIQSKAQFL